MTYLSFLLGFVGVPIVALVLWQWWRPVKLSQPLSGVAWWKVIVGHVVVALLYTTPWDNYLVANEVWWYDLEKVLGITVWWVPLEEYGFFVLQTILVGMLLVRVYERWSSTVGVRSGGWLRWVSMGVWLISTYLLLWGGEAWRYLTLILSWGLLPVIIQYFWGWDILVRYWRQILVVWLGATLYLSGADALAIADGIWTISPTYTLGIYFGPLPLEEAVFFGMVNLILVQGVTLVLSEESWERWRDVRSRMLDARI